MVFLIPEGMNPKVNVITPLQFEPAYFEAAVQHFSHSAQKIPYIYLWANKRLLNRETRNYIYSRSG